MMTCFRQQASFLIMLLGMVFFMCVPPALADMSTWMAQFRLEAINNGIPARIFDAATANFAPLEDVVELDRKQPEKKITFKRYMNNLITDEMVERAQSELTYHDELLSKIEKKYGVSKNYIVALWAIESRFGENTGGFSIIDSLLTLAYEGRRADFFRKESIQALKILANGDIPLDDFSGSWAGAMGQCQFMPSTYLQYAVDEDGDGRRDIWGTPADIFGSMANYLSQIGWDIDGENPLPVTVNQAISSTRIGVAYKQSLREWMADGVTAEYWPTTNQDASLIQPDGPSGDSYLVFNNFRVLMKWNRSTYFATTVSLLAQRISS